MNCIFERLAEKDRAAVVTIFNHFVEHSFAAYPEQPVGPDFFDQIMEVSKGYPAVGVKTEEGCLVGFGFLRPFHLSPTFRRTAEIGYFILPEHTGRGLGGRMLAHLIEEALLLGVDNVIASVSSRNEQSLAFHVRKGFERCGRFRAVGRKFGEDFDVVWFQRKLWQGAPLNRGRPTGISRILPTPPRNSLARIASTVI